MFHEFFRLGKFSLVSRALGAAFSAALFFFPVTGQTVPTPTSPPDRATDQPTTVTLRWNPVLLATSYDVQISTNSGFQPLTRDPSGTTSTSVEITDLVHATTYYWRVRAVLTLAPGAWSDVWSFTTGGPPAAHRVVLSKGWNMISSFVRPYIAHLDTLAASIMNNLVIIRNGNGQVYFPTVANSLINWNASDGYQVYMRAQDTLIIDGNKIVPEATPLPLSQGWHLISYFRNDSLEIETALSSVTANIVLVKTNDGRVYWPSFGVNQIHFLKPGQGYHLYLSSASTLTYPANAGSEP